MDTIAPTTMMFWPLQDLRTIGWTSVCLCSLGPLMSKFGTPYVLSWCTSKLWTLIKCIDFGIQLVKHWTSHPQLSTKRLRDCCFCGNVTMSYRLCLVAILNAKPGEFTSLMGFLCSSWTAVNMGTSGRSVADPLGRGHRYVEEANCMASRFLWPY